MKTMKIADALPNPFDPVWTSPDPLAPQQLADALYAAVKARRDNDFEWLHGQTMDHHECMADRTNAQALADAALAMYEEACRESGPTS